MMGRWKKILLWTVGAVLLLVVGVFTLVLQKMRPTQGPRIGTYPTPRTALLVIDIQEDYTGPNAKKRYRDGDRIVAASNVLLAKAQAQGAVVVFVENVIDNPVMSVFTGGINAPGAPGTEMDRRLLKIPGTRTFTKGQSDAFSNPELDLYLRQNQIDRLLITGLDGAYCVDSTTRGALNRGYHVTLFSEGIATESGQTMEKLVQGWQKAGAKVKAGTEF